MMLDTLERARPIANVAEPFHLYEDPLDADQAGDEVVVTTRRALVRLALVATETASRFERERIDMDPMAWMVAPRRLFDGQAAIDACLDHGECLRAVILHGLSMGMDADPQEMDLLTADDEEDLSERREEDGVVAAPVLDARSGSEPRLWTSFMVTDSDAETVQGFDALIAIDRAEAEARLRARYGPELVGEIEIVEGFDASRPLAEALVSPALADMLEQVARDPSSPLAAGLTVSVQQRFSA